MKAAKESYAVGMLLLFALTARVWGIGDVAAYYADEVTIIPNAEVYTKTGIVYAGDFYHPPLKSLLISGSIKLFGNNPYGWRLPFVFAGTLSVLWLYLLGREVFSNKVAAYIAALLLAVEPLHIVLSRTAWGETLSLSSFLLASFLFLKYMRGTSSALLLAGLFFGISLSIKWYYLPALGIFIALACFSAVRERKSRCRINESLYIFSSLVLLPAAVYLIAFLPWFGRGYDLGEFMEWQVLMYRELQAVTQSNFPGSLVVLMSGSPVEWFTMPLIFAEKVAGDGRWGFYSVVMSNFPFWMLAFPSLLFISFQGVKSKRPSYLFPVVLFVSVYLLCLLVRRPLFLYSALQAVPFAHLAVGFLLASLAGRSRKSGVYYGIIIGAILIWGGYLYPFVLGFPVPDFLYSPLVSLSGGMPKF
ncbi:MAG: phospholipid carrier-dependent glycosyltransferase [Nitrospirae bacterium]|nr:MAG: phospholipid carrier-dependent glycosyltransferase [Nitrospirota bacterium]